MGNRTQKADSATSPVWFIHDGLGSGVGEADGNSTVTSTRVADVYGITRYGSGTNRSKYGFVGATALTGFP